MVNKQYFFFLLPAVMYAWLLVSCEDVGDDPEGKLYGAGVYVVNEGFFNGNNGSISHYNPDDGSLDHHIFEKANGRPPGDVIQSFAVHGDSTGFIMANGSGRVEIVNLQTFKSMAEPISASYPRYFLAVSESTGYLTNGSLEGHIFVVDLNTFTITDSVPTGLGPETMARIGNRVYVCNSGGWSADSTLTVINTSTGKAEGVIYTGMAPSDIVVDGDHNIWVYCKGRAVYSWEPPYDLISETPSYLQKVDPVTSEIIWQQETGKAGDFVLVPPKLAISADGRYIYYLRPEGVFRISASDPAASGQPVIPGSYYGIEVDPSRDELYLFEASLTGTGNMHIYDVSMNLVVSHGMGIMPNGAAFVNP